MRTVSWGEFMEANPALANHVQWRFEGNIAYFATVRSDGWPRTHPLGVMFRGEKCMIVMGPSSPKGRDLRRNGRYAVHCTVEDNMGGGGEVLMSGIGVPAEPTEEDRTRGWIAFELLVGEVLATRFDAGEKRQVSQRWRPPS